MNETELKPAAPEAVAEKIILTRADFKCEASESVTTKFPDDGWHVLVDRAIAKVNETQELQQKGGVYLYAAEEGGKKYGCAAVRWEQQGVKAYSMFVGERWEIASFVNAMMNAYGPQRPSAKARADARKAKARAEKKARKGK